MHVATCGHLNITYIYVGGVKTFSPKTSRDVGVVHCVSEATGGSIVDYI